MPYKVILTYLDASPDSAVRVTIAGQIAIRHSAHLIGLAPTSLADSQDAGSAQQQHQANQIIQQNVIRFEQACQLHGVKSFESRRVANTPLEAVLGHARFADLVVIGETKAGAADAMVEQVLLHSSRPTLIVPAAFPVTEHTEINRVLIAWDGSQAASHAISAALPLLQNASDVVVAIVHKPGIQGAAGLVGATELRLYLARHDITANLQTLEQTDSIANTLLATVRDWHANALVMGGYGHSRLRERLLGGTTRSILSEMDIPVLMTH